MEASILNWIRANLSSGLGDFLMPVISRLGDGGLIWIVFTVILLLIPRLRKYGIISVTALLLSLLFCNILAKPLIARGRPFIDISDIELLIPVPGDFSFPSGHASAAFASAVSITFAGKRLGIPALMLAVLIAFSRLYLCVHYVTDVLAGVALGIGCAFLARFIYEKIFNKFSS
jgi:undecaprenyl-diphosphatase